MLNLGCGNKPLAGAVNHDLTRHSGFVDVAHDLNTYPWPWPDNSFDRVCAIDVVEHLDSFIDFFDEAWRILAPGGEVQVQVPRWTSDMVAIDPTHKRGYHPMSFDYLDPDTWAGTEYGMYTKRKWQVADVRDGENILAMLKVRK